MRNGTLSKLNKLVLVNSNDQSAQSREMEDAATDNQLSSSLRQLEEVQDLHSSLYPKPTPLLVFVTVSIACAATAIATGSYALWLSRHQAAHQALTDVNDLLKSCQNRMQQLESEVQRLPMREG